MTKVLIHIQDLSRRWGAYVLSLSAALAYFFQSFSYAHTQISVLDEGAYLVKGLLFATGRYTPFQDYGPLTNHMPLAFLIPGWVQVIFGPGLRTGRYFAIFLGLLMLVGLWLLVTRLRNPWWAALVLAVIAVNPALIKMYSVGVSQVLVSCLLVWTLFFSLGPKRPVSHLVIASILAAAIWFMRINMAPVLLLLLGYIYWEYGWSTALKCAAAGFGVLLLGHLLYWPGILKLWAYWLPERLTPFLNPWRLPAESVPRWSPEIDLAGRANSLFQAVRFNLLPVLGLVAGLILWKKPKQKKDLTENRAAIFLALLFAVLFILHGVASLGGNYCVYCFQVYLGFFDVLAIVFFVLAVSHWGGDRGTWVNALSIVLILSFGLVLGLSAAESLPSDWWRPRFVRSLLDLRVPGGPELWILIQNKYGMDYQEIVSSVRRALMDWLPALIGLLTGAVILLLAYWLHRRQKSSQKGSGASYAARAWSFFLFFAFLLSPTIILGRGYVSYNCSSDVIASYEAAGANLAAHVAPNALVYWTGGDSAAPLLYTPKVEIFPAQLNDGYSFRIGGDSEILHRMSYWDEPLRTRWLDEADFLLIEDRFYDDYWVNTGEWSQQAVTPPVDYCRQGASIHILERVR